MKENIKDFYLENGYYVAKKLIPDEVIDNYKNYWLKHHAPAFDGSTISSINNKLGWENSASFIHHDQVKEVLCHENLYKVFDLIGLEKMGLHLSFTSWYSTLKTWHQDYTNSDRQSAENYTGIWIALDDIHPDSGPFDFIPKSHLWDIDFNIYSDSLKSNPSKYIIEKTIENKAEAMRFLPKKGDVIFWHGHLVHRGSEPNNFDLARPCIIGHYYSSINGHGSGQRDKLISYKNGFYFRHDSGSINLYD
jgi:ectoine hydroxylase-related dioxygenase (phytanoyl-CoA dioxygenase family)